VINTKYPANQTIELSNIAVPSIFRVENCRRTAGILLEGLRL
jgi:hypothetical protein